VALQGGLVGRAPAWAPLQEAGGVDDVAQVDQPLPEEEVEGGRLVLGDDLEVGATAVADHLPVLDVEEDAQEEEGCEIEQEQTSERVPEQLPDPLLAGHVPGHRVSRRWSGHDALHWSTAAAGPHRRR
jgi:hypothetical protein